jgi:hypothetical protein
MSKPPKREAMHTVLYLPCNISLQRYLFPNQRCQGAEISAAELTKGTAKKSKRPEYLAAEFLPDLPKQIFRDESIFIPTLLF